MADKILSKGAFDLLSRIQSNPAEAYGAGLHTQIMESTGKDTSLGAIYTVLERLDTEGLVSKRWGDPTPQRGGRRKRFYMITAKGQRALTNTEAAYRIVPSRVDPEEPLLPEGALAMGNI